MTAPNVNNDEFNLKQAEWRGYVLRALEDINKELEEARETQKKSAEKVIEDARIVQEKLDKINDSVNNIKLKVAGISAGITVFVSYILPNVMKLL